MLGGFCLIMRVTSQALPGNSTWGMTSCYFSGCLNINSSRYVEFLMPLQGSRREREFNFVGVNSNQHALDS